MLKLLLGESTAPIVLCIGAHCDDIEIGCGGTLGALAEACPDAFFHCWVFSGDPVRSRETERCLTMLLGRRECFDLVTLNFRDSYFPGEWSAIKEALQTMSHSVNPDIVFSHATHDLHQDHRVVGELTWTTFRDHLIFEYEIAKFDGDLGRPNIYVPLSAEQMNGKVDALTEAFVSQREKRWFSRSTFEGMARLRGIECNAPSGFAEAFFARKLVVQLPR